MNKVYKLTHFYSRLTGTYAVSSPFDLEEFNHACAYLQLLREELPSLPLIDDVIGEDEAFHLLQKFYRMKPVILTQKYDHVIDLHENWECIATLTSIDKLNAFAVFDGRFTMLDFLYLTAKDNFERCSAQSKLEYVTDFKRLSLLLEGETVQPDWQWVNLAGDDLTGLKVVKSGKPDYLRSRK